MICAIVLAAGQSRRMGTQKLLLPLAGQTVIGHIIEQILLCRIQQVFVVVSDNKDDISQALTDKDISLVINTISDGDMLSSVRAGIGALPQECEAALLVLGDQPSIEPQLITRIIQRFHQTNRGIIVPIYDGKRGHPLLFSQRYFAEVLTNFDGVGLRGLLQTHPADIEELTTNNSRVLEDMDYHEDYQRERLRFSS